jgi:hypothetical protein
MDDQARLTLRIPRDLYARFEAVAAARTFHRGAPQLARYVREAMEEWVVRHTSRPTESHPTMHVQNDGSQESGQQAQSDVWQSASETEDVSPSFWQTEHETPAHGESFGQTAREEPRAEPLDGGTPPDAVAYDATTRFLGQLCKYGHDYQGTGQSLRRRKDGECLECQRGRKARQRQRQGATA